MPPVAAQPPTTPNLNSVTTIREDGSRRFLHPADARGRFTAARRWSGWLLIAIYLSLPWIKIGGHPAVFLDVADRRFHLFGLTLAAQDLWLLFFLITGLGFSLFFVTALLGRIWCGWACPQTVFLDHVFRRIERLIEGDAVARRALAAAPLTAGKFLRRVAKHALYVLAAAVITHLLLAYFVSLPEVWAMVRAAPAEHWSAFAFVAVFTGALYFNFAWFREQLCIVICPYGRIQSALIDSHSLVIGYDAKRGEPRGKQRTEHREQRTENVAPAASGALADPSSVLRPLSSGLGACIDCNRCVQVCPTGIDIRQGLQMECIGCAACIDACDEVMAKVHRPAGLVRYASQNAFAGKATRWLRPRTIVYGVLLLIGAAVATWAFSGVRPANLGITRLTGAPYFVDAATVRNQFLVRLVNKRSAPARLVVTVRAGGVRVVTSGFAAPVELAPLAEDARPLILQVARRDYAGPFHFTVEVGDEAGTFTLAREAEFIGPDAALLREDSQ